MSYNRFNPMAPFPFHQQQHQPQIFFNPMLARNQFIQQQHQQQPKQAERGRPVTTVFVGNISEKCSNEFMQQMLQECGAVSNWKRIQGSNGRYQAFGFCDYELPEGTLRALRVLNDFQVGEKKLVVKAEDKVRDALRTWAIEQRKEEGKAELKLKENELPADEDDLKKDEEVRLKILNWMEQDHPMLLTFAEDGELSDKEAKENKMKEEKRREEANNVRSKDSDRRRRRSRSDSPPRSRNEKRGRGRGSKATNVKRRRHSSSRSSNSSRSSSGSSSASSHSRSRSPAKKKDRSASRGRDSDDSEGARERKELKKQIKEKEKAYQLRLDKWEARERQKARQYEREEKREKERKVNLLKEAKKLKNFLEDYDDLRDDSKYYKSSNLFQRKRDFEREREADSKDRWSEQCEIDELKKQIIAEKKSRGETEDINDNEAVEEEAKKRHREQEEAALRKLRADSGSPNPHQPLGQGEDGSSSSSAESEDDEEEEKEEKALIQAAEQQTNGGSETANITTPQNNQSTGSTASWQNVSSPDPIVIAPTSSKVNSPSTSSAAIPPTVRTGQPGISQRLNGVFGLDEDEETDGRRRMRHFEITREERIQNMTPEEKKKLTKELIDRIPIGKDNLFAFDLDWNFVDDALIKQRLKPWVSKKIAEYIGVSGDEEQALIDFVCDKIVKRTSPEQILDDIAVVLDDDAEMFVVKMWRLLVYESEAKKIGISGGRSNM